MERYFRNKSGGLAIVLAAQDVVSNGYFWGPPAAQEEVSEGSTATRKTSEDSKEKYLQLMIAFLVTIVPFYHGMNCHLDRIYLEQSVETAKQYVLIIDFFAFFFESCLLLALALKLDDETGFLAILIWLLIADIAWGALSYFVHSRNKPLGFFRWVIINAGAVALLVAVSHSTNSSAVLFSIVGIATARTIADYTFCWQYYFPSK